MGFSTAQFAQAEALKKGSPASQWTLHSDSLQQFWKWGGNWSGIQARLESSLELDRHRRLQVANALLKQYERDEVIVPSSLKAFKDGAHVITTGHQLQAGGGPAYFHYKILSAVRWARRLSESGEPAVAIFWMASEDHDFEEIQSTFGVDGSIFRWEPQGTEQKGPVGELLWDEHAEKAWQAWVMENNVDSSVQQVCSMPLSARVRKWVSEWFGDLNVLVIDGHDAELKNLAMHLWQAEWEKNGIGNAVQESADQFQAVFGKPQIQPRKNNLFVLTDEGSRQRADRWIEANDEEAWRTLRPEQHSPNVALRPIYQEFLLQSIAFVGGPSEVSYWMLLGRAFEHHCVHPPALLVRDSALILNEPASAICELLSWNPSMLGLSSVDAVNLWADGILEKQGDMQLHFDRWSEIMEDYAKGIHESAIPTTRATLSKMEKELVTVKKKWRKIIKQQHHDQCVQIAESIDDWISPKGVPQERVLSALALVGAIGSWSDFTKNWLEVIRDDDEPQFLVFQ
jgi:uncharacterized protein YllA (UPF0747 family)